MLVATVVVTVEMVGVWVDCNFARCNSNSAGFGTPEGNVQRCCVDLGSLSRGNLYLKTIAHC